MIPKSLNSIHPTNEKIAQMLLFALILCFASACTKDSKTDSNNNSDRNQNACEDLNIRVINGDQCRTTNSPVVEVVPVNKDGFGFAICTGTMITPRMVLTAAHCIVEEQEKAVVILHAGEKEQVIRAFVHPKYDGSGKNDLGILELSRDLNVSPVPLLASRRVSVGDEIGVFGFGINEKTEDIKISDEDLRATHMVVAEVNETLGIIIAYYDDTKTSGCAGDSGGPITTVQNGVTSIVGTVHGGNVATVCKSGTADYFTNIQASDNLNFITKNAPEARLE